jgi:3-oxoacyl-(acyl-carrier-protein) synthase
MEMIMNKVYLHNISCYVDKSTTPLEYIKKELEKLSGEKFRRINRYIYLALRGVFGLKDIRNIPKDTSIYIGTQNGVIAEIATMLDQIHTDKQLPMPFTFIASSVNMASFYISSTLGINGSSYTISNDYAAFEMALDMAYRDIKRGTIQTAIVGSNEESEPVAKTNEGGVWSLISNNKNGANAQILSITRFASYDEAKNNLPSECELVPICDIGDFKDFNQCATISKISKERYIVILFQKLS